MQLAYLLLVQKLEKEMSNSSNECCEVEDSHSHQSQILQPFLPHVLSHLCCHCLAALPSFFPSRLSLEGVQRFEVPSCNESYWVIIYSTVIKA